METEGVTKKILQDSRQEELRRRQLARDRGVTFGNDLEDPCKKVRDSPQLDILATIAVARHEHDTVRSQCQYFTSVTLLLHDLGKGVVVGLFGQERG